MYIKKYLRPPKKGEAQIRTNTAHNENYMNLDSIFVLPPFFLRVYMIKYKKPFPEKKQ